MMEDRKQIYVKIGEIGTAKSPDVLKATLGSCVGVAVLWKQQDAYGLAHCLLPKSPDATPHKAKYVNQAIPYLLSKMKIKPENYKEIEVCIAGGGNVVKGLKNSSLSNIGTENSDKAREVIDDLGLPVSVCKVGGTKGWQIVVDCSTGQVSITNIPSSDDGEVEK